MMPGIFVNGSIAVWTVAGLPAGTAIRRGHSPSRRPSGLPSAPGLCGRATRLPGRATGRAATTHSPGLMPRTSAVTATGPLPGRSPSAITSWVKVSPGLGLPVTWTRRPENQIVARNGSPRSPGSSQKVGVRISWSMPSAHPETRPAVCGSATG